MAKVAAKNSDDFNKLLRRFKRQVIEDGIIDEVKKRQHFVSKGQLRKEAKNVAVRRNKRRLTKEQERNQRF